MLRAILVSIPSVFLGISARSSAQVGQGEATVVPGASRPGETSTTKSPTTGRRGPEARESGTTDKPKDGEGNAAQEAPQATSKTKQAKGGGYTWSEKKPTTKGKTAKPTQKLDPQRPLAQAPNFEMRADGSSVVTLNLSRTTEISQQSISTKKKTNPRVTTFLLKHAQIGVRNNTNPLITEHFQTPLRRVVLRRNKKGAILQLEFREDVQVTHSLKVGPAGSVLVEITIPKPTKVYSSPATYQSKKPEAGRTKGGTKSIPSDEEWQGAAPGPEL